MGMKNGGVIFIHLGAHLFMGNSCENVGRFGKGCVSFRLSRRGGATGGNID